MNSTTADQSCATIALKHLESPTNSHRVDVQSIGGILDFDTTFGAQVPQEHSRPFFRGK